MHSSQKAKDALERVSGAVMARDSTEDPPADAGPSPTFATAPDPSSSRASRPGSRASRPGAGSVRLSAPPELMSGLQSAAKSIDMASPGAPPIAPIINYLAVGGRARGAGFGGKNRKRLNGIAARATDVARPLA